MFGTLLGGEAETAELLEELVARVGADPASTSSRHLPYRKVKRHMAEHGPNEEPAGDAHPYCKSEFFGRPLPAGAIAELVAHLGAGRAAGEWRELDFMPWGGAYNWVPAGATAFVHRDDRFLLKPAVVLEADASAAAREAARRWLAGAWELVHPFGSDARTRTSPTRSSWTSRARTTARTPSGSRASGALRARLSRPDSAPAGSIGVRRLPGVRRDRGGARRLDALRGGRR